MARFANENPSFHLSLYTTTKRYYDPGPAPLSGVHTGRMLLPICSQAQSVKRFCVQAMSPAGFHSGEGDSIWQISF